MQSEILTIGNSNVGHFVGHVTLKENAAMSYAMWLIVCRDIIHMHHLVNAAKMNAEQARVRFVAQQTVILD